MMSTEYRERFSPWMHIGEMSKKAVLKHSNGCVIYKNYLCGCGLLSALSIYTLDKATKLYAAYPEEMEKHFLTLHNITQRYQHLT